MIDGIEPYPAYKESGLIWLGNVPEHWEVRRGKTIFQCIDVRSTRGEEELLTVSSERGVVPRRLANVTMFKAESYAGYKLCWPGDLVINSLWAWARGLGVSPYHGIISSAYGVYRLRKEQENCAAFIHVLVRSTPFRWELYVRSKGIWISRLQLTDQAFLDAPFPLPPFAEQVAIVRFLDYADRRIRKYIRAKQKLIKLLEEQKQAIIYCAVTRGFDTDVQLKSSGVRWLGDLPKHWTVLQARRMVTFVTSGSRGWASYYSETGSIFLQSGNLGRSMALNMAFTQHVKPPMGAEGERTLVKHDDILICITGALTGNVVHVDMDLPASSFVNQHVALMRPNAAVVSPRYLAYVLHSEIGRIQFKIGEYGGTKQGLGLDDIKSALVLLPPMAEQIAIARQLDVQVAGFGKVIRRIENEISLLREYHSRLNADVVTGKLDVREAAARLPEEALEPEALDEMDDLPQDESAAEDAELEAADTL